jgi:hypothetical protein
MQYRIHIIMFIRSLSCLTAAPSLPAPGTRRDKGAFPMQARSIPTIPTVLVDIITAKSRLSRELLGEIFRLDSGKFP